MKDVDLCNDIPSSKNSNTEDSKAEGTKAESMIPKLNTASIK